jgi:hypothetical protein
VPDESAPVDGFTEELRALLQGAVLDSLAELHRRLLAAQWHQNAQAPPAPQGRSGRACLAVCQRLAICPVLVSRCPFVLRLGTPLMMAALG